MNHEIPEIPGSADELLAAIDRAKTERPSLDIIEDLKKLAHEMTQDCPVQNEDNFHSYPLKEGYYKLVDGKEVEVTTYLHDVPSQFANTIITTIHKIRDSQDN